MRLFAALLGYGTEVREAVVQAAIAKRSDVREAEEGDLVKDLIVGLRDLLHDEERHGNGEHERDLCCYREEEQKDERHEGGCLGWNAPDRRGAGGALEDRSGCVVLVVIHAKKAGVDEPRLGLVSDGAPVRSPDP